MFKVLALSLLLIGCAPMTELQKEDLRVEKLWWVRDYNNAYAQCRYDHGIMVVNGPSDFRGVPQFRTSYYCEHNFYY